MPNLIRHLAFAFLLSVSMVAAMPSSHLERADLVLLGGKIVTMDPERPAAEAIAMRGDRILAVGSGKDIGAHVGDGTQVIRLNGRLVIPGFIEGHGHFVGLGESLMMLDLRQAKTFDDIVRHVEGAAR